MSDSGKIIDEKRFRDLYGDDSEMLSLLVGKCHSVMKDELVAIVHSIHKKSPSEIAAALHTLQSSISNYPCPKLSEYVASLQQMASLGNLDGVAHGLIEVRKLIDQMSQELLSTFHNNKSD